MVGVVVTKTVVVQDPINHVGLGVCEGLVCPTEIRYLLKQAAESRPVLMETSAAATAAGNLQRMTQTDGTAATHLESRYLLKHVVESRYLLMQTPSVENNQGTEKAMTQTEESLAAAAKAGNLDVAKPNPRSTCPPQRCLYHIQKESASPASDAAASMQSRSAILDVAKRSARATWLPKRSPCRIETEELQSTHLSLETDDTAAMQLVDVNVSPYCLAARIPTLSLEEPNAVYILGRSQQQTSSTPPLAPRAGQRSSEQSWPTSPIPQVDCIDVRANEPDPELSPCKYTVGSNFKLAFPVLAHSIDNPGW